MPPEPATPVDRIDRGLFSLADYREMWRLAWPVSVSTSTVMLLMVANLFWIGRIGTEAVAAVSLTSHVLFMAFGLTQIVFVGTLAVIARRTGERSAREAYVASVHALVLGVLLGVAVSVLGVVSAAPIIGFFDLDAAVESIAVPYLQVTFAGHVFFFVTMAIGASYQGTGNTRTPMILNALVVGANAVIDPILIFAPGEMVLGGVDVGFAGLGVVGAAVADVVASALGCAIFLGLWRSPRGPFPLAVRGDVRIRPAGLWQIVRIGVPASVTMLARPLSTFFLLKIITSFGTVALAAFGIVLRALSLNFIPMAGLNAAVSTLVGQSLGARQPGKAHAVVRRGLAVGVLLASVFFLLYTRFAETLISVFDSDPGVVALGIPFFYMIAVGQLFTGPAMPLAAAMNGSGDTRPPMFAAIVANWPVKLPLAWALALPIGLGISGVWAGMLISMVAEAVALAYWFGRGRWQSQTI